MPSTINLIDDVTQQLLTPVGLAHHDLQGILNNLMTHRLDYGDLYFQLGESESWHLEEGQVKDGQYSAQQGVGIRVIKDEKTGFAYSDEISLPALKLAVTTAKNIVRQGQSASIPAWQNRQLTPLYTTNNPFNSITTQEKITLLTQLDQTARNYDPRVKDVMVNLSAAYKLVLITTTEGILAADIRPLVHLNVNIIAQQGKKREQGRFGGGGRYAYDYFFEQQRAENYVKKAVDQALQNLEAQAAPAGNMTVVLGAGWPGVLLHEAVGHGLEGDFNRKGSSAFSDKVGQKVASSVCNIVDDGTLVNRRGSLTVDDEGTPTQCTPLVENGILIGYMQDKLNARLMGMACTGNGRRQSYAHLPLPRMTNTYMRNGDCDPQEIIASVDKGIYAVSFSGGQVDITSGKFVFSANEAYLIEQGKVTRPIKGATLIGNGPQILMQIEQVGNDLALDSGIGTCGKEGQHIPVGVGQPTLKINGLTVGGTLA